MRSGVLIVGEPLLSLLDIRVGHWAGFPLVTGIGYFGLAFGLFADVVLAIGYAWLGLHSICQK